MDPTIIADMIAVDVVALRAGFLSGLKSLNFTCFKTIYKGNLRVGLFVVVVV